MTHLSISLCNLNYSSRGRGSGDGCSAWCAAEDALSDHISISRSQLSAAWAGSARNNHLRLFNIIKTFSTLKHKKCWVIIIQ